MENRPVSSVSSALGEGTGSAFPRWHYSALPPMKAGLIAPVKTPLAKPWSV
jgi:hypothetical protein